MHDEYYEPGKEITIESRIRKSVFIGHVRICGNEETAREKLKAISAVHKQATHNCWAYRVGIDRVQEYYSDDGEPGGTAGKPIMGALLRNGVTNCLLVVTRYYGGVKLGVRGLIEAYGNTAQESLNAAGRVLKRIRVPLKISLPYDMISNTERMLLAFDTDKEFCRFQYDAVVSLCCAIPAISIPSVINILEEWKNTGKIYEWEKQSGDDM
jgi:uncharacterized YigZ family protein